MSFYNPTYLILLVLVPVIFIAAWVRESVRLKARNKFATPELFSQIATVEPSSRNHIRSVLIAIALILLFVAFARPQGGHMVVEEKVEGIEIVLAIDISKSMLAEDLHGGRLKAIKNVVNDFIKSSYGDRIGLVAFAGDAVPVCPLTTDHESLTNYVDRLTTGGDIRPGTGIGNAIHLGVNRFRDSDSGRVMILLTDGENNKGIDPMKAVDEAIEAGVRIYTVGIGTPEGAPLPESEQSRIGVTNYRMDPQGERIMVHLDEETLKKIAEKTGGEYFSVSNNRELRTLYGRIAHEGETEFQTRRMVRRDEFAPYLLFIAALFLIMEAFYTYITPRVVRYAKASR